jgi:mannitol/fructose-specific phosphotransferase system IIA component (Ntr-type)
MLAIILFLDLEMLVKTASTLMILLFGSVNIAVIIMRESGIQSYQPKFKSPLYPWIQIAGLLSYIFLLFEMGIVPLAISAFFLGVGLLWYAVYGRIYAIRQSALVHLVRRMTPKELTSYSLNEELREILRERDDIEEDRFDILVKHATVFDIEGSFEMKDAFKLFAETLSGRVGLSKEQIYELLLQREADSSTVIMPGFAIPHIILPGEETFEIMLARSKAGINFPHAPEPVHAIFILAGTYDERNFHLKVLMSIAQVVQKPDFMTRWLNAAQKEELKDIMLLGGIL